MAIPIGANEARWARNVQKPRADQAGTDISSNPDSSGGDV